MSLIRNRGVFPWELPEAHRIFPLRGRMEGWKNGARAFCLPSIHPSNPPSIPSGQRDVEGEPIAAQRSPRSGARLGMDAAAAAGAGVWQLWRFRAKAPRTPRGREGGAPGARRAPEPAVERACHRV